MNHLKKKTLELRRKEQSTNPTNELNGEPTHAQPTYAGGQSGRRGGVSTTTTSTHYGKREPQKKRRTDDRSNTEGNILWTRERQKRQRIDDFNSSIPRRREPQKRQRIDDFDSNILWRRERRKRLPRGGFCNGECRDKRRRWEVNRSISDAELAPESGVLALTVPRIRVQPAVPQSAVGASV